MYQNLGHLIDWGHEMETGMGPVEERAAWADRVLGLARIGCMLLAAGSLAYLAIAGVHYAVSSGLRVAEEVAGTRVVVAYSLAMFALLLLAGVAVMLPGSGARRARALCCAAALPALAVAACEATALFGVADSAFGTGFLHGFNLFFGVLALAVALAAAAAWRLHALAGEGPAEPGPSGEGAPEGMGEPFAPAPDWLGEEDAGPDPDPEAEVDPEEGAEPEPEPGAGPEEGSAEPVSEDEPDSEPDSGPDSGTDPDSDPEEDPR